MSSPNDHDWSHEHDRESAEREEHQLSSTPPRPSYSPVTPTIQPVVLASAQRHQPVSWIEEPPSEPVRLEDNPDAIAMRAAISILQIQRQQSLQDVKDLDKIKAAALRDPQGFLNELKAGKLSKANRGDDPLNEDEGLDVSSNDTALSQSTFGTLPQPQNVVRAPPVNWDKYHVLGDPLEKMHEQQRRRPSPGDSATIEEDDQRPDHTIAAPYRPFVDKLSSTSAQGRRPANSHG